MQATAELVNQLKQRAELNRPLFHGPPLQQPELLRQIIGNADLVFGLFPDKQQPGGHGLFLIKGTPNKLMDFSSANFEEMTVTSLYCEKAEAETMSQMFGGDASGDALH